MPHRRQCYLLVLLHFHVVRPTGLTLADVNENRELTPKHAMLKKHEDFKEAWAGSETCEWLLREAEFKTWKNMERGCSLFWLYGRRRFS